EHESYRRGARGGDVVEPLYTVADAEACLELFVPLKYGEAVQVTDGVKLRLQDAGHILGAASAEVWLEGNGVKRRVVFRGAGGHSDMPLLRAPTAIDHADLVVCESTYGDRNHRSWDETVKELGAILRAAERG